MAEQDDYEVISPSDNGNAVSLIQEVVRAEIDTQIATAKQYPRSLTQFVKDATEMVTLSQEVAESCNYGLPRAGKVIEGPSVRFAELILGAWGNASAGARVVHEDSRFITAQGICRDMQRNVTITMEVKRRVTDSKGKTYKDDMIGVTGNAASSIALRNAILRLVPKAFWEGPYLASRKTALGDSLPMANRRANALAAMQKFGATPEMIFAKLEIKGEEDLTIEHLSLLSACRNSIKDGAATVEDLFAVAKPADDAKGNNAVKDKLAEKAGKKKPTKEEAAAAAGANTETGELPPDNTGKTLPSEKPDVSKKEENLNTSDEHAQKTAKSEHVEGDKKAVFNTGAIPVKGLPDQPTVQDFDGWQTEFVRRCNTAPSLEEIATLYKQNAKLMNQFKGLKPDLFAACEIAYNDNVGRLKDAPAE